MAQRLDLATLNLIGDPWAVAGRVVWDYVSAVNNCLSASSVGPVGRAPRNGNWSGSTARAGRPARSADRVRRSRWRSGCRPTGAASSSARNGWGVTICTRRRSPATRRKRCCWRARSSRSVWTGPRMGVSFSIRISASRLETTCGRCRSMAIGSRRPWRECHSARTTDASRLTGTGSPTNRTRADHLISSCQHDRAAKQKTRERQAGRGEGQRERAIAQKLTEQPFTPRRSTPRPAPPHVPAPAPRSHRVPRRRAARRTPRPAREPRYRAGAC